MIEDEKAWESGAAHPPRQPAIAQTCRILRELALPIFYMGGKIENLSSKHCCAHLITFGEWAGKGGELPYASEERVSRLRRLGGK